MKIITIITLLVLLFWGNICLAEMSTDNFKITSDVIGGFGTKESSTSFELGDTGGEFGTGDSESNGYKLGAGFWSVVGDDNILIFNLTDNVADLGTLSNAAVRYDTAGFNAATTAQGGYVIQFAGTTLSFESNQIDPLSTPAGSSPGSEQFGFNLRANSTPSVGADPSGGYGEASSGYDTANSFKFSSGDTIAQVDRPSGQTNYVASFIGNIEELTDAGQYLTSLTITATGRY
jgi:hypothetical protein